ncbi:MAG: DUF1501 domain-containing protein [Pirellulaceae bacterium]|nr:DUF1501 domain-containing protein [Pirellulaceae bacterium]
MTTRSPDRREFLRAGGVGLGSLALSWLSQREANADLHHPPRAKSVIWLFMEGGPSHLDLVDPKPLLNELSGQPLPASFQEPITAMGERGAPLLKAPRTWKRHGQSGLWASEWIPHIAECADDIAVIRSCWTNGINHAGGVCQMNTCINVAGRPSLGSWIHYGLGTANENLPSFVVMCDSTGRPVNGPRNWGSGFMPASHQGVRINGASDEPIANLNPPDGVESQRQSRKLELLQAFNQQYAATRPQQSELDARIRSYELAFRMQADAPAAVDLANESAITKQLYGMDQKETETFGRNCLLARRLVERGVRFVQLYSGTGSKWDSHTKIEANHSRLCKSMDRPVAGLLKDLKQRGLLDETLVVWGGEFGRTPFREGRTANCDVLGRDHYPDCFSI